MWLGCRDIVPAPRRRISRGRARNSLRAFVTDVLYRETRRTIRLSYVRLSDYLCVISSLSSRSAPRIEPRDAIQKNDVFLERVREPVFICIFQPPYSSPGYYFFTRWEGSRGDGTATSRRRSPAEADYCFASIRVLFFLDTS